MVFAADHPMLWGKVSSKYFSLNTLIFYQVMEDLIFFSSLKDENDFGIALYHIPNILKIHMYMSMYICGIAENSLALKIKIFNIQELMFRMLSGFWSKQFLVLWLDY